MFKNKSISLLLALTFLLSACVSQPTAAPTALPTIVLPTQTAPPTAIAPTETVPPPTATQTPSAAPTATPFPGELPEYSAATYLDDRSTAAALMLSYFNAINRQEYLRAYSYYSTNADIGTLDQFASGYSDTQTVSVVLGDVYSEGAAGSIYFTIPMILNVTTTSNTPQKFAACYVLRMAQPANFGAPPVIPMHIERGTAKSVPVDETIQDPALLGTACPSPDFPTGIYSAPATVEQLADLSSANYIDNRSDAVALMSSYVNAINRKEYAKAYTYWQTPPEPYDAFASGYTNTGSVTAQFGTPFVDVNEAQTTYSLPVVLVSTMNNGSIKTYAGCYTMQLTQPTVQTTLPFQSLGFTSAAVNQVDNNADVPTLLINACQ